MANSAAIFLLFLVTLFGLIFQGSDGVKDVQLEGPRYARRGEDLMLRCNYDLETDSLYAVKWYRGSEEFYRFIPKEAPPKQAFPINGVVVDVNKSDHHSVFLRNISFDTNGRFKCVISAEETFQTLENAKDIEVIVIDYNSPKLSLDKMGYQPGERGVANCSVEQTNPAPNITWFINGKQVHLSVSTKVVPAAEERSTTTGSRQQRKGGRSGGGGGYGYTTPYSSGGGGGVGVGLHISTPGSRIISTSTQASSTEKGIGDGKKTADGGGSSGGIPTAGDKGRQLSSSVSTLSFPIQSYSPLTIKCTGTLYDVYNETSSIHIQPKAPINNPYNNPSVSTPRSQHKYGQPNQLQTFNQTTSASSSSMANNGMQFSSLKALPFFITALMIIVTTTTNAQFPEVPYRPLLQRLYE